MRSTLRLSSTSAALERIRASSPVNAQAARSAFAGGDGYELPTNAHERRWCAPPPTRAYDDCNAPDMTGTTVGRLEVVGYYGSTTSRNRGLWVVRCRCGSYEVRRTKTLRNAIVDGLEMCCHICKKLDRLREQYSSVRRGKP